MLHLELRRSKQRARTTYHNVLAVGHPLRGYVQARVALRDLRGVRKVEPHGPYVVAAATVGDEHQRLAVWAEPGLRVERHALGDSSRLPAFDRQRIQITQKIENDRLSVGAHVERHPRRLGGRKLGFAVRVERERRRAVATARSTLRNNGRGCNNREAERQQCGPQIVSHRDPPRTPD